MTKKVVGIVETLRHECSLLPRQGQCGCGRSNSCDLVKHVHRLARFGVLLEYSPNSCFMVHHNSESSLEVEVKSNQHVDQSFSLEGIVF